jgi:Uma2 family endonuclease
MATQPTPRRLTVEEYLRREREATERSEYLEGEILAMAGASLRHNAIVASLTARLYAPLRERGCGVYSSDMRVQVAESFLYPDVVIVCGQPILFDAAQDAITNPTVIVEVLSESTERLDRGRKSWAYRRLPSLQDYVLVSQEEPRVEHWRRGPDGAWLVSDIDGLQATLKLVSIGAELPLAEIYEQVSFEPAAQ